jgi:hypothetical protein
MAEDYEAAHAKHKEESSRLLPRGSVLTPSSCSRTATWPSSSYSQCSLEWHCRLQTATQHLS